METRRGVMTQGGRRTVITSRYRGARDAEGAGMAEKGKSRGAGTRSKQDKPRAQPRQSKKGSPRSSGRTSIQLSPSPDAEPQEPLDVEPILDELLERVLIESALAAVARQRVPFAVSRARDAILFVAEWCFLVRDDTVPDPTGDPDPERDGVWKEDEEPPAGLWDSRTSGVLAVAEAFSSSEELSSEDVSVAAEAESPPVSPGEVPAAAPALGVPLPPGQFRSAAAAARPAQLPGPRPPRPKPLSALQPRERGRPPSRAPGKSRSPTRAPGKDRQPSRAPGKGRSPTRAPGKGRSPTRAPGKGRQPSRAPGKGRQPSRPPQPPAAPAEASQPPAQPPAAPPEPAAPAAPEPREGAGKVDDREPPTPSSSSSSSSEASIQSFKPARSAGVPRLRVRRGAARWVLPEVKVLDVSTESERPRLGASRTRMLLPGSHVQVLPGTPRAPRVEPQLCDPWLASVHLAPGVTVRWGGCERRGPALAGHGGEELGDEALRRAEKDLKPILPHPECRLAEYRESEEWQDDPLEMELPGLPLPAPLPALGGSGSPRVSPVQWLPPGVALSDAPGDRGSLSSQK